MYLDPACGFGPDVTGAANADDGGIVQRDLLARIAAAFPALPLDDVRMDCTGGDHVLLIVREEIAFRFPRAGRHALDLEIAMLAVLRHRLSLAIPDYAFVDPAGRFAGYRFIAGVALTPARYGRLAPAARDGVLDDLAGFLRTLHDLDPADVGSALPWPRTWSLAAFAARAFDQRLPVLAARLPDLATPIRRFLERIAMVGHRRTVVVHGDLVAEHILLDGQAGTLAGIIDFGDLALGDPAQDLLVAWSYGEAAAARIVRRYDPAGADPGLLERSRCHFLRYRIDRLFDRLCEETDEATIGWEAAELGGHLARFAAQH